MRENKKNNSNRRNFIKKLAVGSAAIALAPTILTGKETSTVRIKTQNEIEILGDAYV